MDDPSFKPDIGATPLALRHFVWTRPLARWTWRTTALFWGGAAGSLVIAPLQPLYDNALAAYLFAVLLPPLVFGYLAVGWFRQEIDAGRIVFYPTPPLRDRSVGGWPDPMSDPLDPRSGPVHWQHFE